MNYDGGFFIFDHDDSICWCNDLMAGALLSTHERAPVCTYHRSEFAVEFWNVAANWILDSW